MSLDVVTWLWGRELFGPEDVNKLHRGLVRHLHAPFRFWCITDHHRFGDFDAGVRAYPMFTDHAEMRAGHRACFRRLQIFDQNMARVFGRRILQLDLDTVFVDDVTPLFTRTEPLMMHLQNETPGRKHWNPSMLLMDAGVAHSLWARFHAAPTETWQLAKSHGWACSDMSVINDHFNSVPRNELQPVAWTKADGVTTYWRDVKKAGGALPEGSRIVLFYGHQNIGDAEVMAGSPWIKEHWL